MKLREIIIKEILLLENKQLADKLYFNTDKIKDYMIVN